MGPFTRRLGFQPLCRPATATKRMADGTDPVVACDPVAAVHREADQRMVL